MIEWNIHTNLVQSTLVREDSDMSVVGASCGESKRSVGDEVMGLDRAMGDDEAYQT